MGEWTGHKPENPADSPKHGGGGRGSKSHSASFGDGEHPDAYRIVYGEPDEPREIPVDDDGNVSVEALGMNAAPQDAANALLDDENTVAVPEEEYPTPGE